MHVITDRAEALAAILAAQEDALDYHRDNPDE